MHIRFSLAKEFVRKYSYLHITSCVSKTRHISGFLSCPSYIIACNKKKPKINNDIYDIQKRAAFSQNIFYLTFN